MPTGISQSVVSPAALGVRTGGNAEQAQQPRQREAVAPAAGASSESIQAGDERALLRAPDAGTETRSAGAAEAGGQTESEAASTQNTQVRPQTNGSAPGVGESLDMIV